MSKTVWNTKKSIKVDGLEGLSEAILAGNGYSDLEIKRFLNPSYESDLGDPFIIDGMQKAVGRIGKAIKKSQKIVIYGDYDIDGLSASTLLYDALTQMGNRPELYIPDRFEEGYGLNSRAIEKLKKEGAELVISVDCGVTAHEQAKLAKQIELDLIITDHHEPDGKAPAGAVATINPKLQKRSPLRNLAGVGVAFYLVLALQNKLKLIKEGGEKWLLDMVALGTVCDVVPMTGINRTLTKYGLIVLAKSRRAGIIALCEQAGIDQYKINEGDLGFKIGPRLNAAGRLTHAKSALELLTTHSSEKAKQIAVELNGLNAERQQTTKQIYDEADSAAKQYSKDPILVLHSPGWSHGVVGIVASRLAEKWHKPVILLQELPSKLKGSARSFGSFSIVDAIRNCGDLLESYGGHAFAAGLQLKPELLKEFRYRINQYAVQNMEPTNNLKVLEVGISLPANLNSIELFEAINSLAPFGNENQRPICSAIFNIEEVRMVGADASHLRLKLSDDTGGIHEAIGFGMANKYEWLEAGMKAEFAYSISENIWNNARKHQIEIIEIRKNE